MAAGPVAGGGGSMIRPGDLCYLNAKEVGRWAALYCADEGGVRRVTGRWARVAEAFLVLAVDEQWALVTGNEGIGWLRTYALGHDVPGPVLRDSVEQEGFSR
jgi:hypothetical protein